MTQILDLLLEGMQWSYDEPTRAGFLREIHARRDDFTAWVGGDKYLKRRYFDPSKGTVAQNGPFWPRPFLPTLVHGDLSPDALASKFLVLGANPGWSGLTDLCSLREDPTVEHYVVNEHQNVFRWLHEFQGSHGGSSRYWNTCEALLPRLAGIRVGLGGSAGWPTVYGHCIAQDLVPLHSKNDRVTVRAFYKQPVIKSFGEATLAGLRRAPVGCILALAPLCYELVVPHLSHCETAEARGWWGGKRTATRVTSGFLGETPVLAVDCFVLGMGLAGKGLTMDTLLPAMAAGLTRLAP